MSYTVKNSGSVSQGYATTEIYDPNGELLAGLVSYRIGSGDRSQFWSGPAGIPTPEGRNQNIKFPWVDFGERIEVPLDWPAAWGKPLENPDKIPEFHRKHVQQVVDALSGR